MEEKEQLEKNILSNIQNYLSLGYVYLLILGIVRDAVYYGFLGVDILKYSNVSDVLLSPLILLTNNIIIPTALLVFGSLIYFFAFYSPIIHNKYRQKKWYKTIVKVEKWDEKYAKRQNDRYFIVMLLFCIMFFYLGTGIGAGSKIKEELDTGNWQVNSKLIFNDGEEKEVKILGQNSEYVFYVADHNENITISPILSNIKKIKKIKVKN